MILETEAPDHRLSWKLFGKQAFDLEQQVSILRMLTAGLAHFHQAGLISRDLHPTRIHLQDGVAKWNLIGMPYNFKKLVRSKFFTGHLDFTAPELIVDPEAIN